MTHVLEHATTSRSQCRACGARIERDQLRFGERRENTFGEGEATSWFHPLCAAYARPEQLLEVLNAGDVADADSLRPIAEASIANPKLPRLKGAERSPTGRASCRQCQQPIAKGDWRLGLMFFEEFRFNAGGFIHAGCAGAYFGTTDIMDRVRHFSPDIPAAELDDLENAVKSAKGPP
jgi:Poly(ADP-ribose) polymerase and DNA-Ligase Zn-finger region